MKIAIQAALIAVLIFIPASGWAMRFGLGGIDPRVKLEWIKGPVSAAAKSGYGPGDYGRETEVGKLTRSYEIHVPLSYDRRKPTPLVLVFHGGGGYPSAVRYQSGMDEVADRNGFIVVYPAGTGKLFSDRMLVWNDGRSYKDGSSVGADDVAFVAALLDEMDGLFNVDKKRVYASGISNGAQFTYRLAKQLSDRIAAISTIAGQHPPGGIFPPPSRPMPVMQFSGKEDIYAPYEGGTPHQGTKTFKVKFETKLETVEKAIKAWAEFNGCSKEPTEIKRVGKAVQTRYASCKNGSEVVLWTLEDGGHTWPGGKVFPAEVRAGVGNVNKDIYAPELMWEFFKRHKLD